MAFRDSHLVPELLAPAGSPDAYKAALAAGADAIYCALGSDFNARRQATNFSYESFAASTRQAHLLGVRTYVTINIVIRQDEMSRALALVKRAWLLGADAFIVQDFGLLDEIHKRWPQLECHISTQANVHDSYGVYFCEGFGAKRITSSRELSVEEIRALSATGAEIEGFGHGAICFCYSGTCEMSSLLGGRSANRGQCAQPCRLPYELLDTRGNNVGKVGRIKPLCPKDFCSFDKVGDLSQAGLGSLKIEGRMKSPDYVYAVTSAYRYALDKEARGEKLSVEEHTKLMRQLSRAFNRGFTSAYLEGTSNDDMMSYERSNNQGEIVGRVVSSRKLGTKTIRTRGTNGGRERRKKLTEAEVIVYLTKPVGKGDLLEFRDLSNPDDFVIGTAPEDAVENTELRCITSRVMQKDACVRVVRSEAALQSAERALKDTAFRKRPIRARVKVQLGEPIELYLETVDGNVNVTVSDFVVESARTKEISEVDVAEHIGRMGTSPFELKDIEIALDKGVGMGFSALHKLREKATLALEEAILLPYSETYRAKAMSKTPTLEQIAADLREDTRELNKQDNKDTHCLAIKVSSPKQANAALAAGADIIYCAGDDYLEALAAGEVWPDKLCVCLDEVFREIDHVRILPLLDSGIEVAAGNVGELEYIRRQAREAELRPTIPLHNVSALSAMAKRGAKLAWLTPELSLAEMVELAKCSPLDLGVTINSYERLMTSEHCVLQTIDACIHDCPNCKLRKQKFYLKNIDGLKLPVSTDKEGRSHIYAAKLFDAVPEISQFLAAGIHHFMIDASLMDDKEMAQLIARAKDALANRGKTKVRLDGATLGHLYNPID